MEGLRTVGRMLSDFERERQERERLRKQLELLSGSHRHLLAEHAGIEAKIEPPDDWTDPCQDV